MVYLHALARVCVFVCGSVDECLHFLYVHAHVLWSINSLFFCQSLSAADQISGRNAETALWKMNLGRSANFSQFGPPSYIQIGFKMQDVYCL